MGLFDWFNIGGSSQPSGYYDEAGTFIDTNDLSNPSLSSTSGLGNGSNGVSLSGSNTGDSMFGNWNLQGMNGMFAGLGQLGNFISGVGNLYQSYNANKLAKQQFNFMKDITNTQLNNAIKDYNTKLAGKYRSQSYYETGHDGAFDDLYEQNKLTR